MEGSLSLSLSHLRCRIASLIRLRLHFSHFPFQFSISSSVSPINPSCVLRLPSLSIFPKFLGFRFQFPLHLPILAYRHLISIWIRSLESICHRISLVLFNFEIRGILCVLGLGFCETKNKNKKATVVVKEGLGFSLGFYHFR